MSLRTFLKISKTKVCPDCYLREILKTSEKCSECASKEARRGVTELLQAKFQQEIQGVAKTALEERKKLQNEVLRISSVAANQATFIKNEKLKQEAGKRIPIVPL